MGCGSSSKKGKKSEKVVRAALIIQNWYRRYRARLSARQHYALAIFQSIEYADEQGQMQLSSFFSFMLENYTNTHKEDSALVSRLFENTRLESKDREEYVGLIDVPDSYDGPRLQFPLTFTDINLLLQAFKQQQTLHAHYVLEVLFEARKILKQMPNFTRIQTFPAKEITICGDLHGKLDDLMLIFYKNGLPSEKNPYVFNGDFVDRGNNSMEILMILLVSFLVYPTDLHLNRGNHEDFMMNLRYGFTKEILQKYKLHGKKILQVLEELYTWLPIGTIIDNEILVIHGGISESTDLNILQQLQRNKMKSVLMPPMSTNQECNIKKNKAGPSEQSASEQLTKLEWEQIIDLLWSDPRGKKGCYPNTSRGGGCYFGPDVTSKVLNKNQLKMVIRSHECKPDGYEICHDGKVITVFSASNYYEEGSNRGAYIRLSYGTSPQFFQYQVTSTSCLNPLYQRVNAMEFSAFRILKERMIARKTDLINAFELRDHSRTGKISLAQWAFSMESILGLNLPWRSLSSHLVSTDSSGSVDYMSSFDDIHIEKPMKDMKSDLIETMYRYRSDLKIIFNIIDTDQSGLISMDEFRTMWKLFNAHYKVHIDDSQIDELASTMDSNKDGNIDFNEFLRAFYVVHKYETPESPLNK
ncbi:serine/threonine-protein phosphatase with EF-hands 1 isoform X2 [Rattus norvegicus]|uniref:Serine/threonine-protein phosphatase with EF-hands 1 n=1 Tax=Rattus norvegicus TaxID=10116 RepID=PPE1_RAT|nr:serine/threonine-protein phosphatase with EF-hands 1 [Rattus norvegicus]XP_038955768.1 serine/threonine-protein phosphatase with EF-hands 1 isoform X2 [Rattus norvegicus]Q3SWT6.1 RecName: Full=Serine/threonine-protein phosphatase with EF-hands 1; Short=PPEF-1 [Rattus norvegicus]AAI04697.1 Protein phosphatase, EF-hand calcium binding domain 1 [Rattus norvegicus]|eukprot:NP_001030107.1 serine/threonine-protein phosphatase with EF-hands 1 [Rattus norvegicus]